MNEIQLRDYQQECVDIKEKIQRAKLYINKTKEEGSLPLVLQRK